MSVKSLCLVDLLFQISATTVMMSAVDSISSSAAMDAPIAVIPVTLFVWTVDVSVSVIELDIVLMGLANDIAVV